MRKLNLEAYNINGMKAGEKVELPYNIKDSLVMILMHPELKLGAVDLLKREEIGKKILDSKENELLLEEEDWSKLKSAFETIKGFTQNDVELVKRVLNAPQVDVKEAKKWILWKDLIQRINLVYKN